MTESGTECTDESQYHQNGHLMGLPQWKKYKGSELFRNFHHTSRRPEVIFEQGQFISYTDSVLVVDSAENSLVSVILYNNARSQYSSDTLYVFHHNIPVCLELIPPASPLIPLCYHLIRPSTL